MDNEYNNVLSYTESQMLHLCNSSTHKIAERTNYSFIRPTNSIYVDFSYNDCLQANYIAFQNTDYSNKWFFAWIDEVIYKSDNACELKYTVDAWSTWFEKWTKKPCYIIREHVNDDGIGANTIPENIDVGEVQETFEQIDLSYDNTYGFYVAIETAYQIYDGSTESTAIKGTQYSGISVYNNGIMGNIIILFQIVSTSDFVNISRFINRTNKDGHIADIKNMYIVPNALINAQSLVQNIATVKVIENGSEVDKTFTFYNILNSVLPERFNTEIDKINSYSGLTIKNNKCYCYPYNYFTVSNNSGANNIFKYELFSTNKCIFENVLSLVPRNIRKINS